MTWLLTLRIYHRRAAPVTFPFSDFHRAQHPGDTGCQTRRCGGHVGDGAHRGRRSSRAGASAELFLQRLMPQLFLRPHLDLSDALARHSEMLADLAERQLLLGVGHQAALEDEGLARIELAAHAAQDALELERLLATRTFQAGMQTVRQLEFALFDLRIHSENAPQSSDAVMHTLADVRAQVAVVHPPAFNRFPHSFQHIFSGGYAAGYYSYKWAEVLAADAFSAFEEQGIFNADVARRFLASILEQGGSRDAMEAFVEFRGRKPKIEPLLKQLGLAA